MLWHFLTKKYLYVYSTHVLAINVFYPFSVCAHLAQNKGRLSEIEKFIQCTCCGTYIPPLLESQRRKAFSLAHGKDALRDDAHFLCVAHLPANVCTRIVGKFRGGNSWQAHSCNSYTQDRGTGTIALHYKLNSFVDPIHGYITVTEHITCTH